MKEKRILKYVITVSVLLMMIFSLSDSESFERFCRMFRTQPTAVVEVPVVDIKVNADTIYYSSQVEEYKANVKTYFDTTYIEVK